MKEFLGKEILVNWPHMIEAKVVTVIDENFCFSISQNESEEKFEIKKEKHDDKMINFGKLTSEIADKYILTFKYFTNLCFELKVFI